MAARTNRRNIAEETISILKEGTYQNHEGATVEIALELDRAVASTILYEPQHLDALLRPPTGPFPGIVEVTTESTISAAHRLSGEGLRVAILNFASARNPGGGFLGGSQAQEESLARCSGLYSCLVKCADFYEYHRRVKDPFYSHRMIFSPDVPVFRDDEGKFFPKPFTASFITSPAVNAGVAYGRLGKAAEADIAKVMSERIARIFAVAAHHGSETLVLGAFGCGVFRNDPRMVARLFASALHSSGATFKRIVFPIFGDTKSNNYRCFLQELDNDAAAKLDMNNNEERKQNEAVCAEHTPLDQRGSSKERRNRKKANKT